MTDIRKCEVSSDDGRSEISVKPVQDYIPVKPTSARLGDVENGLQRREEHTDFLVDTISLLSAGIGNRRQRKALGFFGLATWISNNIIHFSLDFYEAKFVFHVSWASTVALFFVALAVCSVSSIKCSMPWFIRALRKLSREGNYPKTFRRLCAYFKVVRALIIPLSVAAAMGQYGCYAYDDALSIYLNKQQRTNQSAHDDRLPKTMVFIINVIRATSLIHIFYGFWFFLLIHMGIIYMIQSSIAEYTEFMGNALRQTPVPISFSEAVNSFSKRSRFVYRGSLNTTGVFAVFMVVCSTSFVLNAYNYLFLTKYAIYIWFALVPLIWVVIPLIGAAWVTRYYQRYKLVVVNAWVDVPDDGEDDDDYDDCLRGSIVTCLSNTKNGGIMENTAKRILRNKSLMKKRPSAGTVTQSHSLRADFKPSRGNGASNRIQKDAARLHNKRRKSLNDICPPKYPPSLLSLSLVVPNSPIMETRLPPKHAKEANCQIPEVDATTSLRSSDVERYSHCHDNKGSNGNHDSVIPTTVKDAKAFQRPRIQITDHDKGPKENPPSGTDPTDPRRLPCTSKMFSGVAKALSKWRGSKKAPKKFNFEKYLTYLDITLPTIGFSIGGVVITWDAVSGFCFLLFTLVGVFAQEAFFG